VVSNGKLILFHRIENKEVVECLDAKNRRGLIGPIIFDGFIANDFGFDKASRHTGYLGKSRL